MAYSTLPQAGEPSPSLPGPPSRPLSADFESLVGDVNVIDPTSNDSPIVSSLLKSITSSAPSYEMVEDDDYEDLRTPRREDHALHNTSTSEQPPVRTASVSRNLPLNHPIPDLQSIQGAYVRNVERLEESAERLSTTSSLEDEIQRQRSLARRSSAASSRSSLRGAQRPRNISTTSMSNSIIGVNSAARTGGYSPSAYITSPTGSIRSNHPVHRHVSRSKRLGDSRPLDMVLEPSPPTPPRTAGYDADQFLEPPLAEIAEDRPPSAASGDTFQQANAAFADFDGEHYQQNRTSLDQDLAYRRQLPIQRPPRARDSRMFSEAQPGESMIYYPAPVPVMLNLPTKLSKSDHKMQQQRRTQMVAGMNEEARKSAMWLNGEAPPPPEENHKRASVLPPQLRASAFFDHQPGVSPNLQLKNGSAIHTLDSILDAAAYAPVSAFTDHPIVGKLGNEVYGREKKPKKPTTQVDAETKKKRRSSLSNILKIRKSSSNLGNLEGSRITSRESKLMDHEAGLSGDELEAADRSIAPGADELATPIAERTMLDGEDDARSESSGSDHEPGFSGAPTTLLAELQLRKAQQKQRNRTAADAFPNGMHSTLLEMDAVLQLQQRSRKQKHVTLAWEDHEAADKENFDDEDVPLGMLISEKDRANHFSTARPIGLMEKRELEDNEPLSHRRARLRGEPVQVRQTMTPPQSEHGAEDTESKLRLNLPGMAEGQLEEEEGETLAQRRARMREEKEKVTAGNFASDVASHLGLDAIAAEVAPSKTPDAEETLGERKARLKEEAAKKLKASNSMADLLQRNPVGLREIPANPYQQFNRSSTFGPTTTMAQQRSSFVPSVPAHMATLPYYNHSPYMQPGFGVSQNMMYTGMPQTVNPMVGMMPDPMGPPLTNQQRSVIDRWRQGIV
jgi:hypothetical protein